MTHSIPEAQSLVIRTPAGTVFHTGDWKLDPDPLIGPRPDEAALASLARKACWPSSAIPPTPWWKGILGRRPTCGARFPYSPFVARTGGGHLFRQQRCPAGIGRAGRPRCRPHRRRGWPLAAHIDTAARECGYLAGIPPFASEDDASDISDDNLLILVTGSQGEPRSALARIALDQHPRIELARATRWCSPAA